MRLYEIVAARAESRGMRWPYGRWSFLWWRIRRRNGTVRIQLLPKRGRFRRARLCS